MTYDLRRLRAHRLIERIPHTRRHIVTDTGLHHALLFTHAHDNRLERHGGLGSHRSPLFVVLLDLGVLVVDVQRRRDALGGDPGAEPARGFVFAAVEDSAVEDQADVIGRPMSRLSCSTCSKRIWPDTGRSSIWVNENSACRIDSS